MTYSSSDRYEDSAPSSSSLAAGGWCDPFTPFALARPPFAVCSAKCTRECEPEPEAPAV